MPASAKITAQPLLKGVYSPNLANAERLVYELEMRERREKRRDTSIKDAKSDRKLCFQWWMGNM
jgi:hypothetical protein